MSIEQQDPIKRLLERRFARGCRLDSHVLNIVQNVSNWFEVPEFSENFSFTSDILKHYKEFIRSEYEPELAEWSIEQSDPQAIDEFNNIIDEMRQKATEILQGGKQKALPFLERLIEVIKSIKA